MSKRSYKNFKDILKIATLSTTLLTGCYQTEIEIRNTEPVKDVRSKGIVQELGDSVGQIVNGLGITVKDILREKELTKRAIKDKTIILKTNKDFTVKIKTPECELKFDTKELKSDTTELKNEPN